MAQAAVKGNWRGMIGGGAALAILAAALWRFAPDMAGAALSLRPHAPDWALWIRLPLAVQLHVAAATAALLIGTVILFRRKGTGFHKSLGWAWVLAMGTTAVSSLFITGLNGNFYSFIHLLSGWTIVGLPMAVYAVRRGRTAIHKRAMTGMFVGGLLIAGALSFLPGRFMFEFLLG